MLGTHWWVSETLEADGGPYGQNGRAVLQGARVYQAHTTPECWRWYIHSKACQDTLSTFETNCREGEIDFWQPLRRLWRGMRGCQQPPGPAPRIPQGLTSGQRQKSILMPKT